MAEAFTLLSRLAYQGYANAQYNLGKAYRDGVGTVCDLELAAHWFMTAAEQGYAKAQRHIGMRLLRGEGIAQDAVAGLSWLILAAQQGLSSADVLRGEYSERMNATLVLEAEQRARNWSPEWGNRQAINISVGVGINSGQCVVGNMGSLRRLSYSALGDAVNLASRFEGFSKLYGVDIVVSEDTLKLAPEYAAIKLDQALVKGKKIPVKIFALLGRRDDEELASIQELRDKHDDMLVAYCKREWDVALALIPHCRALSRQLDQLYDLFERRIEGYKVDPPPENWDGTYMAQSK